MERSCGCRDTEGKKRGCFGKKKEKEEEEEDMVEPCLVLLEAKQMED